MKLVAFAMLLVCIVAVFSDTMSLSGGEDS